MEKGIAILFFTVMIPCSVILLIAWITTWIWKRKHFPAIILSGIWIFFIGSIAILYLIEPYLKPMKFSESDNYGKYKIDLEKFNKNQSQWQYDNYELTIDKDLYLRLYKLIPKRQILDSVKYEFVNYAHNKRIRLLTDSTHHHIISESPTLYRKRFNNFYYVFRSEKYGNMFFEKE